MALTAGQLTHSRIGPSFPFRLQDRQEGRGHPSAIDLRRHHLGHRGLGPERAFPDQKAHIHGGRGNCVGCRPGACVCGPGRPVGKTLDSLPGSVYSVICRVVESSKATFEFDDVTATKFLMHLLFSGCTN
jgi:hypothetical protein